EIEDRDRNAERFRAQPVEPAQCKFALLLAREPARARQQAAPVLLENLEAAESPAIALLLVGLERIGQKPVAVTTIGVMDLPALFERHQAKIGVLANRVARPAARSLKRGAADEAHRAVHDDGVRLIALDHADVE